MRQTRVSSSRLLPLALMLIALFAGAQVYKWVDEKGQVHFGDCPPDDCEAEELTLPEGPTEEEIEAAQEKLHKTLESRNSRDKEQEDRQRETSSEEYARHLMEDDRFKRCVEAREQFEVLELKVRVFRLDTNGSRVYLKNENRPQEIARLDKLIDQYCDTDPDSVKEEFAQAFELSKVLIITCVDAREKLGKTGAAPADIDEDEMKKYQDYIDSNCPEIDYRDLWIADRIYTR